MATPTAPARRSRTRRLAVAAAIALTLVPLMAPGALAASDWIITTSTTIQGLRYFDGGIVVTAGAELVVRNATLVFNLTQEGGSKLQVDAGGSLRMENCTVRSGTPGFHYNFLMSGHLEMRNCQVSDLRGDAGLGGLEITGGDALIEDSSILNSKFYGAFIKSGSPTIRRTTFDTQSVGVSVLPGASPLLENVTIRNASSIGLKIADSSPVVRNLTVLNSGNFAIGSIGATLDVRGCTVSVATVGLDAVQSTGGMVSGCSFSSVGTGVRAQDSPVTVTNSSFVTVTTGVNGTRSAVDVRDSTFAGFGVGVLAAGEVGGVFGGSATGNSFCGPGTAIDVQTPSFYVGDNTFCADVTSLRVVHLVTLEVLDSGGKPATAAVVELTDTDGAKVYTGATDNDGKVTAALEDYRILPNGERHNATPHSVRINHAGQVTVTSINATSETTIQITLAKEEPPSPLPITREGLFLMGGVLALIGAASATAMVLRSRRRRQAAEERAARGRRRRGPRGGR